MRTKIYEIALRLSKEPILHEDFANRLADEIEAVMHEQDHVNGLGVGTKFDEPNITDAAGIHDRRRERVEAEIDSLLETDDEALRNRADWARFAAAIVAVLITKFQPSGFGAVEISESSAQYADLMLSELRKRVASGMFTNTKETK